jgi:Rod binding domain-containing protein
MSVNPMTQAHAAIQGQAANGGKDKNAKLVSAAHQFESVLLGQLLQVLWKSTPELSKGQGSMYQSMFQGEFADHLSAGRGIGLADMIAKGLGADTQSEALHTSISKEINAVTGARSFKLDPSAAQSNAPTVGVLASVSAAASGMVGATAGHWAKDGTLTTEDLGPVDATAKAGASARATIQNAHGYQGYYKCNLFAFELARRAGLEVPLNQSGTQLDLPSSNRLTQDASDGSLNTGWAHVATGASPASMQDALGAGEAAFMLVGQGHAQAHGHMAMIERPRAIDYDSDGSIRSITFDGWEAQPNGAKHLTSRTWNRSGTGGGPGDRNGLDRIEIIRLNRKAAESATDPRAAAPEGVGPHVQPDLGLSKGSQHPTQRSEDRS